MPSAFNYEPKDIEYKKLRESLISASNSAWHTSNNTTYSKYTHQVLSIYKKLKKHPEYKKSHRFGIWDIIVKGMIRLALNNRFSLQ